VLIRAVTPVEGLEAMRLRRGGVADRMLANGPGKVGQAFAITGEHDGMLATESSPLRLLPTARGRRRTKEVTARVGITRAVEWPLRFLLRA
jgi:DNA-3-methyladenine glycosylase